MVVLVQAVSARPDAPAPQSTVKQLSATVVVVGAKLVVVVGQVRLNESGCHDCLAQLKDTHFITIPQNVLDFVATMLFAPVEGFIKYQR